MVPIMVNIIIDVIAPARMSPAMFVSSYFGREGEDYEVHVKWSVNELIVKTAAIVVVKSSKNLVRAFSQHIYPMPYEDVACCVRDVMADLEWIIQKKNEGGLPIDPVIKAMDALDLVMGDLDAVIALGGGPSEDGAGAASATSSEEEGA